MAAVTAKIAYEVVCKLSISQYIIEMKIESSYPSLWM
jgi:hypothetical protein